MLAQRIEYVAVAFRKPGLGHRESSESIAFIRVRASKIDHEVGMRAVQCSPQHDAQCRQVGRIASAVVELDIEVGGGFSNGKFARPCIEQVNTLSSPAKIAAVPSPWWTSRSTTSTRPRDLPPAWRAPRRRRR